MGRDISEAVTTVLFALDDLDRVIAIVGGERVILGVKRAVADEMSRFLTDIERGED